MKYIIMCGGSYPEWPQPKQLSIVKGEPIVARTIRLLRENGVEDISISSNHPAFEKFGVPVLHHENPYVEKRWSYWVDCFYPMDEPCCYVFGDVVFSPNAIRTIIKTQTDDISAGGVIPFLRNMVSNKLFHTGIESSNVPSKSKIKPFIINAFFL